MPTINDVTIRIYIDTIVALSIIRCVDNIEQVKLVRVLSANNIFTF